MYTPLKYLSDFIPMLFLHDILQLIDGKELRTFQTVCSLWKGFITKNFTTLPLVVIGTMGFGGNVYVGWDDIRKRGFSREFKGRPFL